MPEWRMAEPVDFQLCDGEHVAIVGPNAGGKSMLVDILTGRHPLLQRTPEYDFSPSMKPFVSDNIKHITFRDSYGGDNEHTYFLQQRWNQMEIDESTPTVGALLEEAYLLSESDSPEHRQLQNELYTLFHFDQLLDKYIISLSSGELRKFQLTKVLLSDPRVLIMDNPFIGLDAETRTQLSTLLKTLSEERALQIVLVLSKDDDVPDFVLEDLRKDSANLDFRFNADDVIRYFCDKDAAVLVNPDAFSGNCMKKSDVLKVADWCGANGKLLIVDESDVDFSDDGESLMSNDVLEKYEKSLMVIKSISKSCGLPGLRISVVASGNAVVISEIRQRICQWNINSVAEFALQIFSKYESDYKDSCLKFKKERKRFVKALQSFVFFRVIPSQSGAVLCELTNGQSAEQFCQILIERNVMASGEGKFVSLAVRSREDNDKLLKVLSAL